MHRRISLLALLFCISCAPGAATRPPRAPEPKQANVRAAIIPATAEVFHQPGPTPALTAAPSVTPTPTANLWDLTMLTRGGCCPGAFWSANSLEVRFLARPEPTKPASIYGVPRTGGPAKLVRRDPVFFAADGSYTMTLSGEDVVIERVADKKRWTVTTGGRGVAFSHRMSSVAWTESSDAYTNLNLIQRTLWVADLESGKHTKIVTVIGGGFLGWMPDDSAILASGGLVTGGPRGVWRVGVSGEDPVLLFEADEVLAASISPDGRWLAFIVAFGPKPDRNGLWVLRTRDGAATLLDLFGSYRWRGAGRLLVVPLQLDSRGDGLWQFQASDGSLTQLLEPGVIPFEVANNDWSVSPDGQYVAFRSAADLNLWSLALPTD